VDETSHYSEEVEFGEIEAVDNISQDGWRKMHTQMP